MAYATPLLIIGQATYMGITGTVVTSNLASATKSKLTGNSIKRSTPKAEAKDGAGNVFAKGFAGPVDTLTLKFIPVSNATPSTTADAAANVILPALGSVVTLANTGVAAIDGTWQYEGEGSIDTDPNGPVVITLELMRNGTVDGSGNPTALTSVS